MASNYSTLEGENKRIHHKRIRARIVAADGRFKGIQKPNLSTGNNLGRND